MPRLSLTLSITAACLAGSLIAGSDCQAQSVAGFGFQPFGFYQPYGAQYRSSLATPPYFSLNPPVYYGTRYYRPYGISPFAAPPQVNVPAGYEAEVAPSTLRSRQWSGPVSNPFVCRAGSTGQGSTGQGSTGQGATAERVGGKAASEIVQKPKADDFAVGPVRNNPYAETPATLAARF